MNDKEIRRERSHEPRGGLKQDDIWKIYERVNIGDNIKYRCADGYVTRIEEDRASRYYKRGVVVDKQAYYCTVVDSFGIREGVLWLDVVFKEDEN